MSGTKAGSLKAVATINKRYGPGYWSRIGSTGGKVKGPKGFALDRELARTAGSIGGKRSKRGKRPVDAHSLTDEAQIAMARLRTENPYKWTYRKLGKKFGLTGQRIHRILNGKRKGNAAKAAQDEQ